MHDIAHTMWPSNWYTGRLWASQQARRLSRAALRAGRTKKEALAGRDAGISISQAGGSVYCMVDGLCCAAAIHRRIHASCIKQGSIR